MIIIGDPAHRWADIVQSYDVAQIPSSIHWDGMFANQVQAPYGDYYVIVNACDVNKVCGSVSGEIVHPKPIVKYFPPFVQNWFPNSAPIVAAAPVTPVPTAMVVAAAPALAKPTVRSSPLAPSIQSISQSKTPISASSAASSSTSNSSPDNPFLPIAAGALAALAGLTAYATTKKEPDYQPASGIVSVVPAVFTYASNPATQVMDGTPPPTPASTPEPVPPPTPPTPVSTPPPALATTSTSTATSTSNSNWLDSIVNGWNAFWGKGPDTRGIQIVQNNAQAIQQAIQDEATKKQAQPIVVGAAIAIQSQWGGYPLDNIEHIIANAPILKNHFDTSYGLARATTTEINALEIKLNACIDPNNPSIATDLMARRIKSVTDAAETASKHFKITYTSVDETIFAALAQNGKGFTDQNVDDVLNPKNNLILPDGTIDWNKYFDNQAAKPGSKNLLHYIMNPFYKLRASGQDYGTQFQLRLFINDLQALANSNDWNLPQGVNEADLNYMQCLAYRSPGGPNCLRSGQTEPQANPDPITTFIENNAATISNMAIKALGTTNIFINNDISGVPNIKQSEANSATSFIKSISDTATSIAKNVANTFTTAVNGAVNTATTAFNSTVSTLTTVAKSAVSTAKTAFNSTVSTLTTAAKSVVKTATTAAKSAVNTVKTAATSAVNTATKVAQNAWNAVKSWF